MSRIPAGPLTVLPLLFALATGSVGGLMTADARADAADPADWSVAVNARLVYDIAWADGRIWAALDLGGVLVYDPSTAELTPFTTVDGLGSNLSQCIAANAAGEVWVGSADAGITRILPGGRTRYLTALPDQLDVRALAFSGDNAYYGGPKGGGRIVNGLPERTFTANDGLVDEAIRAIAARSTGAWFGTPAGISEFNIQENGLITRNDGLTNLDVRALAVAGGRVYAGTPTGLFVLDESVPGAPVWAPSNPPLNVEIVDLAGRGDRIAVVGTDRRVWWRDAPDAAWSFAQVGQPAHRYLAIAIDDADGIRLGGRRFDPAPIGNEYTPVFVDLAGTESPYYRQLYGTQFFGLGLDHDGGAWVGAYPVDDAVSHWRADGRVICYTDTETGDVDTGFNDDGWIADQLKNDILESANGAVWVSTFQVGVTRMVPAADDDPAGATYTHLTPTNSPLNTDRVFSIGEDPHGNLWFCSAGELINGDKNAGIDVLLDPQDPYNPASWVFIRTNNSLLGGDGLNRITFEGDRVAWLTIRGLGVQRFVYGSGDGFDAARLSDSGSWRTFLGFPESAENLAKAKEVAIGPDGRHWVATDASGLFAFDYSGGPIQSWRQYKVADFGPRLLTDGVLSVTVDGSGAAWAVTELGLNRVREDGFDFTIDTYTDLQNFLDFGLGEIYSTQVLRPLAGGIPVSAQVDRNASRLFMVSARGLTRVELAEDPAPPPSGEPEFALYPNPIRAGDQLVLDGFEGEVAVEIYDLQGRVLRRTTVAAGEVAWRMETLSGAPVANGLYLVRVTQSGRSGVRVLAVER